MRIKGEVNMLKIDFVHSGHYDYVTKITNDKEYTNIYKKVMGREKLIAAIPTKNITAIYDENGANLLNAWLMNKDSEGEGKENGSN